jgi:hypothetical protein
VVLNLKKNKVEIFFFDIFPIVVHITNMVYITSVPGIYFEKIQMHSKIEKEVVCEIFGIPNTTFLLQQESKGSVFR